MIKTDEWGNLSQDDADSHKYMGACVYHGAAQSIRKFMLGKRLRKNLVKVQKQAKYLNQKYADDSEPLSKRAKLEGNNTPVFA